MTEEINEQIARSLDASLNSGVDLSNRAFDDEVRLAIDAIRHPNCSQRHVGGLHRSISGVNP